MYQQAAQIISFPVAQYPVIPSLLYSFFLYQTDALRCYAAVSSWIPLTWQPKGVLRNEYVVPTVNVSWWWYSLISLSNRPQYPPHCTFHKNYSLQNVLLNLFLYWMDKWWGETDIKGPFLLPPFSEMISIPNTMKSQDIKPIINRAYVFVYTSVARAVLLQKLRASTV